MPWGERGDYSISERAPEMAVSCILQQDEDSPGMCPKARLLPGSKPREAGSERSVACAHCHYNQLTAPFFPFPQSTNLKLHKAAASQAIQEQNTLQLFVLYLYGNSIIKH